MTNLEQLIGTEAVTYYSNITLILFAICAINILVSYPSVSKVRYQARKWSMITAIVIFHMDGLKNLYNERFMSAAFTCVIIMLWISMFRNNEKTWTAFKKHRDESIEK